jgi:hypothetical protein
MSESFPKADWTAEQAAEFFLEQVLTLLDGCDDDDLVRPQVVWEALQKAWVPKQPLTVLPDDMTAGEMRRRTRHARRELAVKL